MATVTLKNVGKTYPGGVNAVRDVSLDIADGEFVVLVGPSGCGKSTVLRMIAGLEEISSGEISIGARVVNDVEPADRDIAMVFQNYALYPHMTVRKNMAFALQLRGLAREEIDRRVNQAAQALGISEFLERRPGQLSGGQRQRVAVGRAIVREPAAFLFDEPLSNLDARLRLATRAELKSLHQRLRTTSVYVTHDQEEAMTLGDRIVVMSGGQIQQTGTPLEVYRVPANRFVAGFVGMPPMNFFEGVVRADGGRARFEPAGGMATVVPTGGSEEGLGRFSNQPVVLGLRPQAWEIVAPGTSGAWDATVRLAEPLGDVVDLKLEFGAMTATARVDARHAARAGDRLSVKPQMGEAHWFEPGPMGRRI